MSSMRIVLVNSLGDVLFSGESLLASGPESAAEPDDAADCPETLRSGESGIFPVAAANHEKRDERAA